MRSEKDRRLDSFIKEVERRLGLNGWTESTGGMDGYNPVADMTGERTFDMILTSWYDEFRLRASIALEADSFHEQGLGISSIYVIPDSSEKRAVFYDIRQLAEIVDAVECNLLMISIPFVRHYDGKFCGKDIPSKIERNQKIREELKADGLERMFAEEAEKKS